MYNKLLLIFAALLACCPFMAADVANDTIYNPNIIYSGMPKTYEIAGIKVTGADNYEDYIIIGYSGLSVGEKVEIPGSDITNAAATPIDNEKTIPVRQVYAVIPQCVFV